MAGLKILFGLLLLDIVSGNSERITVDDGSYCTVEKDTQACPSGTQDQYRDVGFSKFCCQPESKAERLTKIESMACRPSKCVSEESYFNDVEPVICTSSNFLTPRILYSGRLDYDNMLEGSCSNNTGNRGGFNNNNGVSALCCPRNSTNNFLVTDFGVESNEFPFLAKFQTPSLCGAVVYNRRYLITTATCVVDYDGYLKSVDKMKITLATGSVGNLEKPEFKYKVKRVITHGDYSKLKENTDNKTGYVHKYNDIALIELDREMQFGNDVKVLKIVPKGFVPDRFAKQAVIVGYGKDPKNYLRTWPQKQNLVLRKDSDCFDTEKGYYWTMGQHNEQLLCLGGILYNLWSPVVGKGDAGSPVICRDQNGGAALCGVVSYGAQHQKCLDNQDEKNCPPSVAVDLGYFSDWIRRVAGPQNEQDLHKPFLYGRNVEWSGNEHQVKISSKSGKTCGGTLIAKNLVVTAANCVFQGEWVVLGDMHDDVKVTTANGRNFNVVAAEKMSGFKKVWPRLNIDLAHDVFAAKDHHKLAVDYWYKQNLAVVKLSGNVDISRERIPKLIRDDQGFTQGEEFAFERIENERFVERQFKILRQGDCTRRLERLRETGLRARFEDDVMCAVERFSGGSTCDRSLGGGLICRDGNKLVLCGVQVFRLCERSYPNLFMDLGNPEVAKWLGNSISKLS